MSHLFGRFWSRAKNTNADLPLPVKYLQEVLYWKKIPVYLSLLSLTHQKRKSIDFTGKIENTWVGEKCQYQIWPISKLPVPKVIGWETAAYCKIKKRINRIVSKQSSKKEAKIKKSIYESNEIC